MSFIRENEAVSTSAAEDLLDFIAQSPTMFHTAAAIRERLDAAGSTYLPEGAAWQVLPGGAYYTQRNGSSVVAWRVGGQVAPSVAAAMDAGAGTAPYHFQITASHSDSPCFKVKTSGEVEGPAGYLRLDTEAYGGMMDYTWFDRPLSLAGRVLVRDGARIESRLVALNRDVALVPSLAIHMDGGVNKGFAPNRASDLFPLLSAGDLAAGSPSLAIHMDGGVNKGFAPNRASDLFPLLSAGDLAAGSLDMIIADALEVDPGQIAARDLFLVNRERGRVWGTTGEFISSPRLDDLMCAYTSLAAFIAGGNERAVSVYACFDNEEVGSETKQSIASAAACGEPPASSSPRRVWTTSCAPTPRLPLSSPAAMSAPSPSTPALTTRRWVPRPSRVCPHRTQRTCLISSPRAQRCSIPRQPYGSAWTRPRVRNHRRVHRLAASGRPHVRLHLACRFHRRRQCARRLRLRQL